MCFIFKYVGNRCRLLMIKNFFYDKDKLIFKEEYVNLLCLRNDVIFFRYWFFEILKKKLLCYGYFFIFL